MAAKKIYTVIKVGEAIEELKTLAAAKKLADEKEAEVFCDGKCIYTGTTSQEPIVSTEQYRLKVLAYKITIISLQGIVIVKMYSNR